MTNIQWLRREKLISTALFGFFLAGQTLTCAGLMLCAVTLYPDNNIWILAVALFILFLGNIVFTTWSHLQTDKMYKKVVRMVEHSQVDIGGGIKQCLPDCNGEHVIGKYTYNWYRQDFPPTIYDGVATSSDGAFEVRIGGVTHGVVFGDGPAFSTSCGYFHNLDDAKSALVKQFTENEDKYLVHKTPVGGFKPSSGFFDSIPGLIYTGERNEK